MASFFEATEAEQAALSFSVCIQIREKRTKPLPVDHGGQGTRIVSLLSNAAIFILNYEIKERAHGLLTDPAL